ncbi:MAG: hypothetical protein A2X86_15095 [Bdellovibrionales bacterium GWA2_49_15]|nr:MAG: hypothetical protein A2X86_15095 [Bdellovibrionales bacterium GWA2_49_15]HAZ13330.1 hypothetical protein [Bdellovibrionales bacterium]
MMKIMSISKKDPHNPNVIYQQLKTLTNAAGLPLVGAANDFEIKVQFVAKNSITPGKFKAHPSLPNTWFAHPQTIRALRPDIFVLGEDGLEDFESLCQCNICHQTFDRQFFILCPHCLRDLPL